MTAMERDPRYKPPPPPPGSGEPPKDSLGDEGLAEDIQEGASDPKRKGPPPPPGSKLRRQIEQQESEYSAEELAIFEATHQYVGSSEKEPQLGAELMANWRKFREDKLFMTQVTPIQMRRMGATFDPDTLSFPEKDVHINQDALSGGTSLANFQRTTEKEGVVESVTIRPLVAAVMGEEKVFDTKEKGLFRRRTVKATPAAHAEST